MLLPSDTMIEEKIKKRGKNPDLQDISESDDESGKYSQNQMIMKGNNDSDIYYEKKNPVYSKFLTSEILIIWF